MKTGSVRAVLLPAALLAAMILSGPVRAAGDQAGLISFDSGRETTWRAVEQALREAEPLEQLDWTFTLRPSVLYRRYLDERGGDLTSPRLSATLQVRFGEKPLETVRRTARLERALRAHDRAGRLEVRDAFLAHAELLLAQDAAVAASGTLAGLVPDSDVLEVRSAELAVMRAQAGLERARSAAAAFSFHGEATYAQLRFARPDLPAPGLLSAWRLQELNVREAEVRLHEAGAGGLLKDFRVGFGYRTPGTELDVETGLLAGRPGLRVGTVHPGGRERMEVRLSAELAVSDSLGSLALLEENLQLELRELARLEQELSEQARLALEDAELAEAELDYAEAELAEAAGQLEEALVRLAELPGDTGARERERAEVDVQRARRETARLTTRVYRAWITYVRRQHDLLEAVEGTWAWR